MFGIENKACSNYNSFTGVLKHNFVTFLPSRKIFRLNFNVASLFETH